MLRRISDLKMAAVLRLCLNEFEPADRERYFAPLNQNLQRGLQGDLEGLDRELINSYALEEQVKGRTLTVGPTEHDGPPAVKCGDPVAAAYLLLTAKGWRVGPHISSVTVSATRIGVSVALTAEEVIGLDDAWFARAQMPQCWLVPEGHFVLLYNTTVGLLVRGTDAAAQKVRQQIARS